jgi:hypothetical protein
MFVSRDLYHLATEDIARRMTQYLKTSLLKSDILERIIRVGDIMVLVHNRTYYLESKCNMTWEAISAGHLGCLKWLVNMGADLNPFSGWYAAKKGHLHILQYLDILPHIIKNRRAYLYAIKSGHTEVAEWLVSAGWGI